MKRYLFFLAAAAVFLSCKKSATVSPGLFGRWELRHTMGSIVGFDSTFQAGNGRILQFKADSTYLQFNKGKLVTQGKFHIRNSDFPVPHSLAIFFRDDSGFENYFNLNGDKLQLGMDYDDGVESDYQKISD